MKLGPFYRYLAGRVSVRPHPLNACGCPWPSDGTRYKLPGIMTSITLWVSRAPACILLLMNVLSCANIGTSASELGSQSNQDAAIVPGSPSGIACTAIANLGATLCAGTSLCPNVLVDTQQFPNCGFRTLVPNFDLQCVCLGNYLCPVGVAASCQQVSALFSNKSLADVCDLVSLGYCTQGAGSTGTGSTCDQTCYAGCVGAPSCIVACGC